MPLFAGLIHANHGLKVMDYLANELKTNNSEVSLSHLSLSLSLLHFLLCAVLFESHLV